MTARQIEIYWRIMMKSVYESCPVFENESFMLRFVKKEDATDLLEVYSDKNALPFFNSDNCDGDNFFYPNIEKMESAINFWLSSYKQNGSLDGRLSTKHFQKQSVRLRCFIERQTTILTM